ncbi:MAG: SLC13 family permease [Verrucomicrobiae bacterium]|nr:SLC13 family permease [Verrucomicrobiae bacterium]
MTPTIALVFLITGVTFVLFATERIRADALALSVLCVLGLTGLLTGEEILSCFSNPAPITVAAMFILGAGLTRTGALEPVQRGLLYLADRGELLLLFGVVTAATLTSAFINNTAVVMFYLPVVLQVCAQKGYAPSRFLIPLSYASMLGGVCVLIGTSTNIVVNNVVTRHQLPALGMFEQTRLGVILALAGVAYLVTVGRWLLPRRETLTSLLTTAPVKEYRTEVVVLPRSPLIGQRLGDVRRRHLRNGTILGVTRHGQPLDPPFDAIVLEAGDCLIMNLALSGVRDVQTTRGLALLPDAELGIEELGTEATTWVEALVPNNSPLLGRTLRELDFARRHNVRILALHRHGMNVRELMEETPLRFGDTLLLQGTEEALSALRGSRELLLLSPMPQPAVRRHKRWVALAIVVGVMLAAGLGNWSVAHLALGGALLMVLTRCLDMNEAYESINWSIIALIVGSLGLGLAMEKTGGAAYLAQGLYRWLGEWGPWVAISGTYLVATVLTEMVSNNAVAALMTPIAIASAHALDCDPRPFIYAVAFAASASFATPIGYQTNTIVYGAGGYQFRDFLRVGIPLNILIWLLASWFLPLLWPVHR